MRAVAGVAGCTFVALGIGALVAPRASARGYGIPVKGDAAVAYVRAAGARDLAFGVLVLAALAANDTRAAARTIGYGAIVALADALLVAASDRGDRTRLAIHLPGAAGSLIVAALLR